MRIISQLFKHVPLVPLAAVFGFISPVALAQTITGTIRSGSMPSGIPGAAIMLVDSANTMRARTLSGDRGRFTLHAPGAGTYRIRALRIGLRPLTTAALAIAGDTTIDLQMADVPLSLPPITRNEQTQCHMRPDSGLALATLWEDAKTALLTTAITRDGNGYHFDLVDHTRIFDFASRELRSVDLKETEIYSTRTWVSVSPEQLRRTGYVVETVDSTTFIAPDIETLLSDYFIDTHCFRIASSPPGADSLIAVEFEPATKVRHVEVRGTLWVDRRSHELSALDFRYVGLDMPEADYVSGGDVKFTRLTTGGWAMTDWSIRFPVLRVALEQTLVLAPMPGRSGRPIGRAPSGPTIIEHAKVVADRLRVSGGTLRGVLRDTAVIWTRGERSLEVRVSGGPEHTKLAADEAVVYLVGSPHYAFTNSAGAATFDKLVQGAYLIDVGTRELDVLGWPRARVRIDVDTARRLVADIHLESPLVAARAACLGDAKLLSDATGVLIGSVSIGDTPVAGREVTVSWVGDPVGPNAPGAVKSRTVHTLAGDGRFFTCGVPRDRPIEVRVAGNATPMTTRIARDQVVGIVAVAMKP